MEFYGILGEKLGHSLSPRIHKMIFETIGVEGAYKLFEVPKEELGKFAEAMKVLKINGANVTIPYKEEIIKYLDSLSYEAEKIGAVNTIALKDGKLVGYNTDYYGFGYMMSMHNIAVKNKKAVVLGNGGATKAIVQYLIDSGASEIIIVSRRVCDTKLSLYGGNAKIISYDKLKNVSGDILINATPVGMFPKEDECPVDDVVIDSFDTVADIIYNPINTALLTRAEKLGKKTAGGLFMLIGQGVRAEELWQERKIDESIIKDIYEVLNREFS